MTADMEYMKHLREVADDAVALIEEKTSTYGDSWKRRGGVGAWFTVVRPIDRLEGLMRRHAGDIFGGIESSPSGADGTTLACVRDIMNYCILIEAHARARLGVGRHGPDPKFRPACPEAGERPECTLCGRVYHPFERWIDVRNPQKGFCGELCARRYHAESEPSPASGSHHAFIHPDDCEGGGEVWLSHGERLGEAVRADAMERAGEVLDERAQRAPRRGRSVGGTPGDRLEAFRLRVAELATEYRIPVEFRTTALGQMVIVEIDLRKVER